MNHARLQSILSAWWTSKRGFSVVEVLLAVTFFSLTVTALTGGIIYGRQSTAIAGDRDRAIGLAEEGIEALQSIRDQSFNELRYTQSALEITGNKWSLAGEGTVELIDDQFYRTINFSEVCRNTDGDIVGCPGDYVDRNTTQATISVSWEQRFGVNYSVELATYLTNWGSNRWTQSDWSSGPGQELWSDPARYLADDNNIDYATSGRIQLKSSGGGGGSDRDWVTRQGNVLYDETDLDFGQGTFSNTEVSGAGIGAQVVLTKSYSWREHPQSGSVTNQIIYCADFLSEDDIWAGAGSGKILHYDGVAWNEVVDFGNENIFDIDMISSSDGWAVGQSGKIWRYNGSVWSEFVDFGNEDVVAIKMVNASSGWAVGQSAKIWYWNGSVWAEFQDLGNFVINTVDMTSPSSGWAATANGRIYRYNGTTWSLYSNPGGTWYKIDMVDANNGWLVGSSGRIWRWNGSTWSEQTSTGNQTLQALWMNSNSDGWAASSSGEIYRYNGTTWTQDIKVGNQYWRDIIFTTPTRGWIFGNAGKIYYRDNFYQSDGTFISRIFDSQVADAEWARVYWSETLPTGSDVLVSTRTGSTSTPDASWSAWSANLTDDLGSVITSPANRYLQYRLSITGATNPTETPEVDDVGLIYNFATYNDINDAFSIASDNVWAVGNAGTVIRWNGNSWTQVATTGNENLNALYAVSDNNIWAVGVAGKIYHYNGTSWSEHTDTGNQTWNEIYMTSASSGWVVGSGGAIYYFDGTNWTSQVNLGNDLFGIYMISSNEGWAVGASGKIYRYNSTAWSEFTDTGNQTWNDIYMRSSSNGWIAGGNGEIYRYDGTNWTQNYNLNGQQWNTIYMTSDTDGWVAGNKGRIYRYNGTTWIEYKKFGNQTWLGLSFNNEYEGWVVGKNGEIRYYYKSHGGPATNGNLISSAYNMGSVSSLSLLEWDQTIPVCSPACTVKIQLRVAPDSGGAPGVWSLWYGVSGAGTYFTSNTQNIPPLDLNGYQWVQYRVELAGDGTNTPVLDEIRLDYQ